VDLQRQIIADHLALLAADAGHVLYATCSIEAHENEEQSEWIARWHRMRIVEHETRHPHGLPGDDPTTYTDGGFHALLAPAAG
jgi:16S rRNA C967 or C1407 C5-methylase (RsmB/RsmF family)